MKTAVIACVVALCLVLACSAEEQLNACPNVCNNNNAPVCGRSQDGERKTFENQCKMNVYNCQNPTKRYNVIYRKACTR